MTRSLHFGLDYDKTITEDPETFKKIMGILRMTGHKVWIVTMRYPSEGLEIDPFWKSWAEAIIFTSRRAKRQVCEENGVHIDIWIDDRPEAICMDAALAFGLPVWPEGQTEQHKGN